MQDVVAILGALPAHMEAFLVGWTEGMRAAGYLEHTTAKREDCILSFNLFVPPMLEALRARQVEPEFAELLREPAWCQPLLKAAERHRLRGVTLAMFTGCFKTMVHAIADLLPSVDGAATAKARALRVMGRFADAFETVLAGEWTALSQREADERLSGSNRLLTLEKNKYENILATISDMVFVVDRDGEVMEANAAARQVFGERLAAGLAVWEVLGLEGGAMDEVLRYYPPEQSHEIHLAGPAGPIGAENDDGRYFELKVIPLSLVSLASRGYILVLNDITAHVLQRSTLERVVAERTEALRAEKAQLEEMNITLRHVMGAVEKDREADRKTIAHTVETVILPAMSRVRRESSAEVRKGYLDILEDQLVKLAPGVGPDGDARLLKLTPMEMKICRFIRAGSSTKDITEAMNLSPGTIQTHRKNIRRKLGIQGSDINLYTYLQSTGVS